MDELPWVLLGLRTMPKEDLGTSVADMVYGEPLTVPGTFVAPSKSTEAADHMQRMREMVGRLVPAPDAWHGTRPAANSGSLGDAEFVFVRQDASHGPLQTPYTGPYRVLERQEKYFIIQCGEREESVSVDRLKAARAEPDRTIEPTRPPRRGRPPKQRPGRPATDKETKPAAAEEVPAETRMEPTTERPKTGDVQPAPDESEPAVKKTEQQQRPTYVQVTRHGRVVKPQERYIAMTTQNRTDTTD